MDGHKVSNDLNTWRQDWYKYFVDARLYDPLAYRCSTKYKLDQVYFLKIKKKKKKEEEEGSGSWLAT